LASANSPGSSTKKQFSPAGTKAVSACCRAKFRSKPTTISSRAANFEKEGKLAVQVLYPENAFGLGAQFVAVYIKVVQYRAEKIQNVFSVQQ
jgi:hypothetical protein